MTITYTIEQIRPYINWAYFFHAWSVSEQHSEAKKLRTDAESMLDCWQSQGRKTRFRTIITPAVSDGDDIVLGRGKARLPMQRQQREPYLSLADFIRPADMGMEDEIGLFASTAFAVKSSGDPYADLLSQTLADRLAEATAEKGHETVRRELWGYAPDESLTPQELFAEHYAGKRPAIGYPSIPDVRLNFIMERILDFPSLGITLSESGAMMPHASTCGLMLRHTEARHFSIGPIGRDQQEDYALRYANSLSSSQRMDFSSSSS